MGTNHNTTSTSAGRRVHDAETAVGVAEVMSVGVRVAGRVPTRVDLRFAGMPEQQLGLSLGTVLVYVVPRELQQTGVEFAGRLISRVPE